MGHDNDVAGFQSAPSSTHGVDDVADDVVTRAYLGNAVEPEDLEIFGFDGVPEVRAGDDIVGIIVDAVGRAGRALEAGDVVVVTHKIVSKAEGRLVDLREIQPSAFAYHLASTADKD